LDTRWRVRGEIQGAAHRTIRRPGDEPDTGRNDAFLEQIFRRLVA